MNETNQGLLTNPYPLFYERSGLPLRNTKYVARKKAVSYIERTLGPSPFRQQSLLLELFRLGLAQLSQEFARTAPAAYQCSPLQALLVVLRDINDDLLSIAQRSPSFISLVPTQDTSSFPL